MAISPVAQPEGGVTVVVAAVIMEDMVAPVVMGAQAVMVVPVDVRAVVPAAVDIKIISAPY